MKGVCRSLHFKDFNKGRKDTEIGKGEVGYEQLLRKLEPAGVAFMIVEQEQFEFELA